MDHRDERIMLETSRYRITGTVSLPKDGYRSRLTDYLNAGERAFLALTDVEFSHLDGNGPRHHKAFMALQISQIVFASPMDPPGETVA